MISQCTTTPNISDAVQDTLTAGIDELRTRMLRDLELYLSQALSSRNSEQSNIIDGYPWRRLHTGQSGSRKCA